MTVSNVTMKHAKRSLIALLTTSVLALSAAWAGLPKQTRPSTPHASGPELLVNGGFEAPALGGGSWDVFPTIPGWQASAGPGIEVQNNVAGAPAHGAQHIELDSHAPSSMFQDVRTQPNARYVLSLRYSPRPGNASNDGGIEVWFDGERIATLSGSGEQLGDTHWIFRSWVVSAKQTNTRVEFRDVSPANGLGGYLDSVSMRRTAN